MPNPQMSTQELDIDKLLRIETEVETIPYSTDRNAKVNLLKYLQINTVVKYERLSTCLYFDLRRDEGFDQLYRIHEKQGPENGLEQPLETGSIEDYLRQAECAKLCLDQLLGLVSPPGTPRQEVVLASVKSLESTRRKVKDWGGIRRVTDLARATVICDTPHDLAEVFEKLNLEIGQVSRVTWRFRCFLALSSSSALSSRNPSRQVYYFPEVRKMTSGWSSDVQQQEDIVKRSCRYYSFVRCQICTASTVNPGERYSAGFQRLHSRLREEWL